MVSALVSGLSGLGSSFLNFAIHLLGLFQESNTETNMDQNFFS